MAPKRVAPSDELPPRAAPSEEESSSSESIATEEEEEEEEVDPGEETDTESESEPEKPQPQKQEQQKRQPLSKPKHALPASIQDPSSASESESESETESEPATPPKPTPETPKKPKPQTPTPSKSPSSKRPSESEDSKKPESKKKKTSHEGHGSEDTGTGGAASEKKPLFQRVWSDEDEIALLKGMIDFAEKRGVDPSNRMSDFYEFVKKYIKMDASQAQLVNKIRGFKTKFKNSEGKGKDGQDKVSKKPHDQKTFELMKKLWGVDRGIVSEEGPKMNGTPKNKKSKSVVPKEANLVSPTEDKDVVDKSSNALVEKVGPVTESLCVTEMSRWSPHCTDMTFLKGLELIGEKKRAELEERWMKLRLAELKIDEERAELIREQSRLIRDAYNYKE